MKKYLFIAAISFLVIPSFVFAASTVPWLQTNLTDTFIKPTNVNGVVQGIITAASSTIGAGTPTTGLTISGGATSTGSFYFGNGFVVNDPIFVDGETGQVVLNSGGATGECAVWDTDLQIGASGEPCALFPFTPTTNYGAAANSTSTPLWFQNGFQASSTAHLVYASTTALTVSGNAYFPGSGIWNSSGNVGIGTTTPSQLLDIVGASSPTLSIWDNSSATVGRGGAVLLQHTNVNGARVTYAGINASAVSGGAGSEIGDLVFKAMKSGTLTEGARLTGTNSYFAIGNTTAQNTLTLGRTGGNSTTPGVDFFGTISTGDTVSEFNNGRIYGVFDGTTYATARLTLAYPTSANTWVDGLSLKNGNVGIGTTSPGQKLSVAGDILGNRIIGSNFISTSTTASTFAGVITSTATSYNTFPYASTTALTASNKLFVGVPSTFTNPASSSIIGAPALGTGLDDFNWVSEFRATTGNTNRLMIGTHRTAAGSDWNTSAWRIQPAVDNSFTGMASNKGYLEFAHGSTGSYSGLGFSGSGAVTPNVVINTSGNVGIGTTSPWRQLSVGTSNTGKFAISTSTAGCAQFSTLGEVYSTGSACGSGGGTGSNWAFNALQTAIAPTTTVGIQVVASSTIGGGTRINGLTISGGATTTGTAYFAGNMGIGTTTPGRPLSVMGGVILVNGSPTQGLNIGGDVNASTRTANTRKVATISAPNYANNAGIEFFALNSPDASNNDVSIGGRSGGSNTAATSLTFLTAADTTSTGGEPRLAISSTGTTTLTGSSVTGAIGELRLGSANVATRFNTVLYSANTTAATSYITLNAHNGTANADYTLSTQEVLRLVGNGRVGVGSSTPSAKLSVHLNPNDVAVSRLAFNIASSTATATTSLFNIDNIGSVGVGTTTPGSIFSIQGVANFVASGVSTIYNSLRILGTLVLPTLATPAGSLLAVDASGNVIATTTPSGAGGGSTVTLSASSSSSGSGYLQSASLSLVAGDFVTFTSTVLADGCTGNNALQYILGYKLSTYGATTTIATAKTGATGDGCSVFPTGSFTATTTVTLTPVIYDSGSGTGSNYLSIQATKVH